MTAKNHTKRLFSLRKNTVVEPPSVSITESTAIRPGRSITVKYRISRAIVFYRQTMRDIDQFRKCRDLISWAVVLVPLFFFFFFKSAPLGPTGVKTTGIPRCPRPFIGLPKFDKREKFKYKTRIDFNAKKYENSIVNGRTAMGRWRRRVDGRKS